MWREMRHVTNWLARRDRTHALLCRVAFSADEPVEISYWRLAAVGAVLTAPDF
jgi:hypothetical protein